MKILIVPVDTCKKTIIYPSGPLYIAKYLEEYANVLIYPYLDSSEKGGFQEYIINLRPNLLLFSIRNLKDINSDIGEIIKIGKQYCKRIIVGGSGPTIFPRETRYYLKLVKEELVTGEFESNFTPFFQRRKKRPESLIKIPMPDSCTIRKIVPSGRELSPFQMGIDGKRGCKFRCLYCSYPYLSGNKWRMRNVKEICLNIKNLYESGIKSFFFTDSIFNLPKDYCISMLKALLKLQIKARFGAFVIPVFAKEEIELYDKLDFYLELGVDGLTDKSLRILRKPFISKDVLGSIRLLKNTSIDFNVYVLWGIPKQTLEDIRREIEILKELSPPTVWITSGITIYPISPIYDVALNEGVLQKYSLLIPEVRYYPLQAKRDDIDILLKETKCPSNWGITHSQHTENITLMR